MKRSLTAIFTRQVLAVADTNILMKVDVVVVANMNTATKAVVAVTTKPKKLKRVAMATVVVVADTKAT